MKKILVFVITFLVTTNIYASGLNGGGEVTVGRRIRDAYMFNKTIDFDACPLDVGLTKEEYTDVYDKLREKIKEWTKETNEYPNQVFEQVFNEGISPYEECISDVQAGIICNDKTPVNSEFAKRFQELFEANKWIEKRNTLDTKYNIYEKYNSSTDKTLNNGDGSLDYIMQRRIYDMFITMVEYFSSQSGNVSLNMGYSEYYYDFYISMKTDNEFYEQFINYMTDIYFDMYLREIIDEHLLSAIPVKYNYYIEEINESEKEKYGLNDIISAGKTDKKLVSSVNFNDNYYYSYMTNKLLQESVDLLECEVSDDPSTCLNKLYLNNVRPNSRERFYEFAAIYNNGKLISSDDSQEAIFGSFKTNTWPGKRCLLEWCNPIDGSPVLFPSWSYTDYYNLHLHPAVDYTYVMGDYEYNHLITDLVLDDNLYLKSISRPLYLDYEVIDKEIETLLENIENIPLQVVRYKLTEEIEDEAKLNNGVKIRENDEEKILDIYVTYNERYEITNSHYMIFDDAQTANKYYEEYIDGIWEQQYPLFKTSFCTKGDCDKVKGVTENPKTGIKNLLWILPILFISIIFIINKQKRKV